MPYPVPGALAEEALKGGYGVADRANSDCGRCVCFLERSSALTIRLSYLRQKVMPAERPNFEAGSVHYDVRRVAQGTVQRN